MQKVLRDPLFWLVSLTTAAGFCLLVLWQQQYLAYFFYGLASVRQLPIFTNPTLFLGLASGAVAGYTVGVLAATARQRRQPTVRAGVFTGVVAGFAALLSACLACSFSLIGIFLSGTLLIFLHQYQLPLQIISLLLLSVAARRATLGMHNCMIKHVRK